ncbi:MAG: hypothetical protein F4X24_01985 [Rhodobacteraceae bacterium]|nr:hypothetical protein [Paracoccaceae bacterium]
MVATLVAKYGEQGIQPTSSIERQANHDEVTDDSPCIPDPFALSNHYDSRIVLITNSAEDYAGMHPQTAGAFLGFFLLIYN